MSARQRNDELEFGSDSFLDVLANIVGILIILIVIAGVRVSRAPIDVPAALAPAPFPAAAPAEPPEEPEAQVAAPEPIPKPEPSEPVEREPVPLPPRIPQPPAELVARAEKIEASTAALRSDRRQLRDRHARLLHERRSAEERLQSAKQMATAANESVRSEEQYLDASSLTVEETRRTLAGLRTNLDEAVKARPQTQPLEHRITPVGQVVQGEELHFRLSGNRVAEVPVARLAQQLNKEIERQRDRLLQLGRYEGAVGPIDGFVMRYLIERQELSLIDELKYGQRIIRMGVSQWVLEPQPDLVGETADEALQRTSKFFRTLQTAGPVTTLTFWVYPDSFDLYRRLQEFAHSSGYNVAARPLPDGVPITGSPHGAKSVAQ